MPKSQFVMPVNSMRNFLLGSCLLSQLGPLPVLAQNQSAPICPSAIDRTVQTIANRYSLQRYHWGLYVQPLATAAPLANYQGQSLFVPASTTKLLTTAAALRQFGSQYRLKTAIYQDPNSNPQRPALTLVGGGDPTITVGQIDSLSAQLKNKGLQQIAQLTIGTGSFRGPSINPDWEWGDLLEDYGVPVTSLILQQNTVNLVILPQKVGQPLTYRWRDPLAAKNWQIDNQSVTSLQGTTSTLGVRGVMGKSWLLLTGQLPANSTTQSFNLAMLDPIDTWRSQLLFSLDRQQITVQRSQVLTGSLPPLGPEVAAVASPPLIDLLTETNRNSNNLFAEVLLRVLGRAHPNHDSSDNTTADLGLEMVEKKLTEIGVDAANYRQADGSGLSRKNLVAPIALVQTLIGMSKTPEGQIYRNSLAIAGVNGTLANRFATSKNILQGKTGSLTGVVALAGYLNPPQYQPLAFSMVVNNHDRPNSEIRKALDEIVGTFAQLRSCPSS
jgi:D-alanyl-D-alanine carboxypeptidase/D-alanyl-D-alanine-endopeptidase (penicillin-binding protein 4)